MPSLQHKKTLPLPLVADTHAFICAGENKLWLFINQYGLNRTAVFYLTGNYGLEPAGSLPLVASSATAMNNGIMVSGADAHGKPVVIAVNNEGQPVWQKQLNILAPVIWPLVTGETPFFVAWQEEAGKISTGYIPDPEKEMEPGKIFNTGNTAVQVFAGKNKIWAAWKTTGNIMVTELLSGEKEQIAGTEKATTEMVMAPCNKGLVTAWLGRENIYCLLPGSKEPLVIPFNNALGGALSASCNETPLFMVKQMIGEDTISWKVTVITPGNEHFITDQFVYDAQWWQQQVVLLCRDRVIFLAAS